MIPAFPIIMSLAAVSPVSAPRPITPAQMHDIACVAAIAIVAQDQKTGIKPAMRYPDIRNNGRLWAGLVGDRITFETGQPVEVTVFALRRAATAERKMDQMSLDYIARVTACIGQMNAELAIENGIK